MIKVEDLKLHIICVCCFCIAGTVLTLLLPKGSVDRLVLCVLRIIAIIIIIAPLLQLNFSDIKIKVQDCSEMTESVPTQELTELILQQTRMQLEAELDSIIKQYYKDDYNIQIKADILSEQCIHIECIELTLLQEYEYIEQLKNRLMNYYPECEFKIKTEVTGG